MAAVAIPLLLRPERHRFVLDLICAVDLGLDGPYWPVSPSSGKFAKKPLGSLDFEPVVQSVFPGLHFRLWKTYFSFVRFKLKFYLITDLPLSLIAHNFFILTPN